jgi:hypothetical protein
MQNLPSSIGGTAWRNLFSRRRRARGLKISQIRWPGRRRRAGGGAGGGSGERGGSGVEELPKWTVHPDAPFLYGQTAGPDYPAQNWTGLSVPRIIRPKSGPDNPAWNSFAQEICGRKTGLVCMERMFRDEMGLG